MRRFRIDRTRLRLSRLLTATSEGVALGALAAVILAGPEIYLNRYAQNHMLFLAVARLSSMAGLGATIGGLASFAMAAVLARLRAKGSRATAIGVVVFGLLGIGLGWIAAPHWRQQMFPRAALGSISWWKATSVLATVLATGMVLFLIRASEALRSRGRKGPVETRLRQVLSGAGPVCIGFILASLIFVPYVEARRSKGRPSVILISIDTLRSDRLGVMGNPRGLTPHLDALAAEGAIFRQATSTASWTLPSHGSLFTSLLPFDHGGLNYDSSLHPRLSMLAERFRNAGYRTAAFTSGGWMVRAYGFHQGFEVFETRDAFASAARWLDGLDASARYFLFVHTYEPHTPYVNSDLASPEDSGRVGESFTREDLRKLQSGEWELTEDEQRFVADLYDGDVASADRAIGSFLARVDESRRSDDRIVVLFSDHGEELWDHEPTRSADHGHSLYEELLRVPLIFWSRGRVKPGTRIATPVSLLDVAPTLLSLAGLPADPQHRGIDLTESLATGDEPPMRWVFAESVEYGPDRFSARSGDLKVIVAPSPEKSHGGVELTVEPLEVFDLSRDPSESLNLAGVENSLASEIASVLRIRATAKLQHPQSRAAGPKPQGEVLEQLRALGYLE